MALQGPANADHDQTNLCTAAVDAGRRWGCSAAALGGPLSQPGRCQEQMFFSVVVGGVESYTL